MTVVFATNDIADFPGAGITTNASNFRSAYVGSAFSMGGTNLDPTVKAITEFPPVAGDITWIHFQHRKTVEATERSGNILFELRAGDGTVILDFDVTNGVISCRLFGSSTLDVDITDNLFGVALKPMDVKIDLTSDISVEVYDNGILVYDESQAWSSDPGNPEAIHWGIFAISGGSVTQYVSELIIADENTIGMGLSSMVPNAAGNYSAWQGDHVETGDGDLGTGASSDATGQKLSSVLSAFGGPASSALRAIVINNKASTRGGTVGDLRNFLRISSTDYNGAALGVTEGLKTHVEVFETNPDNSSDWDSADFTGTEIGTESLA